MAARPPRRTPTRHFVRFAVWSNRSSNSPRLSLMWRAGGSCRAFPLQPNCDFMPAIRGAALRSRRDGFQCSYHSFRSHGCSSCRPWPGASCSCSSGSSAASSSARWSACRRRQRTPRPSSVLRYSVSPPFLWFYVYFGAGVAVFYFFWAWYSPHPVAELVDPRVFADPFRDQFFRAGQRRAEQLARPFLRHGPAALDDAGAGRRRPSSMSASANFWRSRWSV